MGNRFGRSKLKVKPLENDVEIRKSSNSTSSPTRIKVRMTKTRLEELVARSGDTSKGNAELGRLIVKECLEGRLSPSVVVGQPNRVPENSRSRRLSLSTIDEESI
ncbi:hypothetical protein like AT3G61930 [Hibiscus trionum]|uniref:Uncharacterized protein n=1 Tax=Hibiscus trionum TaxID=183268 RepID=A0A9W7H1V7_HIBTR|nr:hypothetical protein like AT3G61930 [Hibiscus trionum]